MGIAANNRVQGVRFWLPPEGDLLKNQISVKCLK